MENHGHGLHRFVRQAIITIVVVALAVAALDDITTDKAEAFTLERLMLAGSALWFLLLSSRLWREGHRTLGVLSLTFLAGAALAQPWVGQGIAPTPLAYLSYLVTVAALAWFLALAGILAGFAWWPAHRAA
jgi:hypothetical protein